MEQEYEEFYEEHKDILDKYIAYLVDDSWDSMWLYHMMHNYKTFTNKTLYIPESDMNILIKWFGMPQFKNTKEYNNIFQPGELFNSFVIDLRHGTYNVNHIKWLINMNKENRLDDISKEEYRLLMEEYKNEYFCRIVVNAIINGCEVEKNEISRAVETTNYTRDIKC